MTRIRTAFILSVCIGVALFVVCAPISAIAGIVGAVTLIAVGTVGCIETEA